MVSCGNLESPEDNLLYSWSRVYPSLVLLFGRVPRRRRQLLSSAIGILNGWAWSLGVGGHARICAHDAGFQMGTSGRSLRDRFVLGGQNIEMRGRWCALRTCRFVICSKKPAHGKAYRLHCSG